MSNPLDPKPILNSNEFSMKSNPNAIAGIQANESFMLTANKGHVLGKTSETVGFAKYQYNYNQESFDQAQNEWMEAQQVKGSLIRHPDVATHELAQKQAQDLALELEKAEATLGDLSHLGDENKEKVEAQIKVDELKKQVGEKWQEVGELKSLPGMVAYSKAVKNDAEKRGKMNSQNDVASVSANLYLDVKGMRDGSVGGDRALLTRAVASTTVDQFLQTGVIAEEKFGIDSNGNPIGVSIQGDGAGVTGTYQGKNSILKIDYSDPRIQKGLSDLEVNDYITGQIDRHCGNIFIDPKSGKVTGIDNDLAFPEGDREQAINQEAAKSVAGLPHTIDKETADRISKLDPEELRKQLQNLPCPEGVSPMSEASIDGAVKRLKALQQGIKEGAVNVVEKFDENTYNAALSRQNDDFKKHSGGKTLAQSGQSDSKALQLTTPTSYLGAIKVQEKRYELGQKLNPYEYGERSGNSVEKATRDQKHEAYQKMEDPKQIKAFEKTAKEIVSLEKKVAQCQKMIDRLPDNATGMDKFKALFKKDGLDGLKQAAEKEQQKLNTKIDVKLEKLEDVAGLKKQVGEGLKQEEPEVKNEQKQGIGQKKGVSVKQDMEQKQKLKMDNVIGELKQSGTKLKDTNPELVQREGESTGKRNSVKLNK